MMKPEESQKYDNSLQLLCVCLFTKHTVDGMKHKALSEAENYSTGRWTNFLFSIPEKNFASGGFRSCNQTPS